MSESFLSATEGPVQATGGTYLRRKADDELYQACKLGKFSYVLASRQIGKSSLMVATAEKLRQEGCKIAIVELNTIGRNVDIDSWYFSLVKEIGTRLELEIQVQQWWDERDRLSASTQRFIEFLQDVVLKQISDCIVIFIDEIDVTLSLEFAADDFFAAIRTVHNNRAQHADFKRLTFVLMGVATPDDLIRDNERTPFNIGRAIALRDFTKEECELFRQEIKARYPGHGDYYFDQIYSLTNGHPYLTQKLCGLLLEWDNSEPIEDETNLVSMLAERSLILAPSDRGDTNIQFVQGRVTTDQYARQMLNIYRQILQGEEPVVDDEKSPAINRLKLYGLVIAKGGYLRVRNKLYAQIFDLAWVDKVSKNLPTLGVPGYYKILQILGKGAYATVYLAETEAFKGIKNVALKVLDLPDLPNHELSERIHRFNQEAETLRRLEHPNIVKLLETNRSEVGQGNKKAFYIAMEYIPGRSLRQELEGRLLSRDETVAIVQQIGAALGHAHEKGVIHRDVTPNNILLDTSQQQVRPVLTDFGLVKLLSPDHNSNLIKSSLPVGTAQYMAPEQFYENTTPAPTIDVYALGITLFEMVAGQRPTRRPDGKIFPLSSVIPEIGSFFDEALIKATAKDPAERYQTMAEFIEALEAANQEAIEQELKHQQAVKAVEAARAYIPNNPQVAMMMVDAILSADPNFIEALRLKGDIYYGIGQEQEALKSYKQAYRQDGKTDSEAGHGYLNILKRVGEQSWRNGEYQAVTEYYSAIREISEKEKSSDTPVKIWGEAQAELIQKYYKQGESIYASGEPKDLAEAIDALTLQIQALEALGADRERKDLEDKQRLLQIKRIVREGEIHFDDNEPENIAQSIEALTLKIKELEELKATAESQHLQNKLHELQVKQHLNAGTVAFAGGSPTNIAEAITAMEQEIKELEALGAVDDSQDLKGKRLELQINLYYQEGLQAFVEKKSRDLEKAIHHLEALETIVANEEIHELKDKLNTLIIEQHYEPGLRAFERGIKESIAEAIEIIEQQIEILTKLNATDQAQDLSNKSWQLQVKLHYDRGLKAYAEGDPDDLIQAIDVLEKEIEELEALEAAKESQKLEEYRKKLRIELCWNIILSEKAAIEEANFSANFNNELIFQHYDKIDKIYQNLIELDPEGEQWPRERSQNFKEKAKNRFLFAEQARNRSEPDYEAALRHYQRILEIEQTKYEGLTQELGIDDIQGRIEQLKKLSDYDRKYRKVRELVDQGKYPEALDNLVKEFISQGDYEYRDVASLFERLVYAKQHGRLLSELEAAARLKELNMIKRNWIWAGLLAPTFIAGAIFGLVFGLGNFWLFDYILWLRVGAVIAVLILVALIFWERKYRND